MINSVEEFNEVGYPDRVAFFTILREYQYVLGKIDECDKEMHEIGDKRMLLCNRRNKLEEYAEKNDYDFNAILEEEHKNIRDNKCGEDGNFLRAHSRVEGDDY